MDSKKRSRGKDTGTWRYDEWFGLGGDAQEPPTREEEGGAGGESYGFPLDPDPDEAKGEDRGPAQTSEAAAEASQRLQEKRRVIDRLRSEIIALNEQVALLQEENAQLRVIWDGPKFLPPEWKLSRKEHEFVMTLYRKRGVFIDRRRIVTAMYGTAPDVGPNIVNTLSAHVRKKLKACNAAIEIESYGQENIGGYRLSAASINEMDYLLDLSTKPIPNRRQR